MTASAKPIAIAGAGGFAREVLWLLEELGLAGRVAMFCESDEIWRARDVADIPVLPISRLPHDAHVVIGIGNPAARRDLVAQLPADTHYPTFVHPNVRMGRRVEIGAGSVICAGSILTCDIVLAGHAQLNLATTVGHDCRLERFVTTGPAVNISGKCVLGEAAYLGTNACVREGINIASGATVGMGAVVVRDLPAAGVYAGNPARALQKP